MARGLLTARAVQFRRSFPTFLSLALATGSALADEPDAPAPPVLTASADDGFTISSGDGAFRLKIGGYVHADGRFFLDDEDDAGADAFLLRRVRPIVEGKLFRITGFRIMLDFSGGTASVLDAHGDVDVADFLRLRFGKFKSPFGMERLQSASAIVFVERALPTALVPNRDVGAMLHGTLLGKRLGWQLAVMDGVADGASSDGDLEDEKDVVGRLYTSPFRGSGIGPLEGLELGFAASAGDQGGDQTATGLSAYRTSGQLGFFRTRAGEAPEETVVADGQRLRLTAHGRWHWNRFGLWGEWVRSSQRVRLGDSTGTLDHQAFQVSLTGLVTNDAASWEGVEPASPFDPAHGCGTGAIELGLRVSRLDVDDGAFPTFANPDSAASAATGLAAVASWYLNAAFKLVVQVERTTFEGGAADGGDRAPELLVAARAQARY